MTIVLWSSSLAPARQWPGIQECPRNPACVTEEASRAIEYVDDSDGELGGFIGELGLPLAEAILSMELGPVERRGWSAGSRN